MTVRIVTYNIRYGLGKDFQQDLKRIAESVHDADVIALQEVRRNWPPDGCDQPEEIGKLLLEYYWVYGPAFDMDISQKESSGAVKNKRRQFGTMLLAKRPIISSRLHILPKLASSSHFNMDVGALEGVVDINSRPIRFYSIHLSALASRERVMQLQHFLSIHSRATLDGGAWCGPSLIGETEWGLGKSKPPMPAEAFVMGDFNCEANSPEYELMSGKKDNMQGRVIYNDSFVDSWVAAGNEKDPPITWKHDSFASGHGACRLDYCFMTPKLAKKVKLAWVDDDAIGSDHQPYWVELNL